MTSPGIETSTQVALAGPEASLSDKSYGCYLQIATMLWNKELSNGHHPKGGLQVGQEINATEVCSCPENWENVLEQALSTQPDINQQRDLCKGKEY